MKLTLILVSTTFMVVISASAFAQKKVDSSGLPMTTPVPYTDLPPIHGVDDNTIYDEPRTTQYDNMIYGLKPTRHPAKALAVTKPTKSVEKPKSTSNWNYLHLVSPDICEITTRNDLGTITLVASTSTPKIIQLVLSKSSWIIPQGLAISASLLSHNNIVLTGKGNVKDINFELNDSNFGTWLDMFNHAKNARIKFTEGNEPIWNIDFIQTKDIETSFESCIKKYNIVAPAPLTKVVTQPFAATQPFQKPDMDTTLQTSIGSGKKTAEIVSPEIRTTTPFPLPDATKPTEVTTAPATMNNAQNKTYGWADLAQLRRSYIDNSSSFISNITGRAVFSVTGIFKSLSTVTDPTLTAGEQGLRLVEVVDDTDTKIAHCLVKKTDIIVDKLKTGQAVTLQGTIIIPGDEGLSLQTGCQVIPK